MSNQTKIPASQNSEWGFIGTLNEHASRAWPVAMRKIAEATGQPLETVRIFLDSRHGRHFADDVLNAMFAGNSVEEAVKIAAQRWMGWRISLATSRKYGIPRGLPYLTGFVIHCEISELMAA